MALQVDLDYRRREVAETLPAELRDVISTVAMYDDWAVLRLEPMYLGGMISLSDLIRESLLTDYILQTIGFMRRRRRDQNKSLYALLGNLLYEQRGYAGCQRYWCRVTGREEC